MKKVSNSFAKKIEFLPFNRKATLRQALISSMNQYGFLGAVLLVKSKAFGKEKTFVVDGQHRLLAAQYLEIDFNIQYITLKEDTVDSIIKLMAKLNVSQVPWNIDNYIEAYASCNYENYIELQKLQDTYGFTNRTIAGLLAGSLDQRAGGKKVSKSLEAGEFKIVSKTEAINTLELSRKLGAVRKMTSRMLTALHYVRLTHDNFNEKKLIKNYKKLGPSDDSLDNFVKYFTKLLK